MGPFEIYVELRESEREKKDAFGGALSFLFLFLVKGKTGKEKWRSTVPMEVELPLSFRSSYFANCRFFFSSSNFFNFPNVFSNIKIQSSVFIVFVYFDRITLRAYNCISFICCGCVENFWMNFFYDFCIFYLRSFLRNPKLLLLDISIYIYIYI